MDQESRLDYLIDYMLEENPDGAELLLRYQTDTLEGKIKVFQGLCNIRPPQKADEKFLETQDAFLKEWNFNRKITTLNDLSPVREQLYVWQGDITSLEVDAIVNAANSRLLGCTLANHTCIDNIIHTRAGVQLRLACHEIIKKQGHNEPVGKAKITSGYNLPAKYVIHTVGPYIDDQGVTPVKEKLLASSYRSSLETADKYQLNSIAFCCISTGEFNFPNERAAEIAIETVESYVKETESKLQVIFNVFKDEDLHIYQSLLHSVKM